MHKTLISGNIEVHAAKEAGGNANFGEKMMKYYMAPMEGITGYLYRNAYHAYFKPFISEYNKGAVAYKKITVIKVREEEFPKNTLRKILRRKMDMTID